MKKKYLILVLDNVIIYSKNVEKDAKNFIIVTPYPVSPVFLK